MEWPNEEGWCAATEKHGPVVDCGQLVVPTGRLLACDPNFYLNSSDPALGGRFNIPPGKYSILMTLFGNTPIYVSLIVSNHPEVTRQHISRVPLVSDHGEEDGGDDWGFPVETGTACLVDEGALAYGMPADSSLWKAHIFARIDEEALEEDSFLRREISDEQLLKEHPEWADDLARRIKEQPAWGLEGYSLPEDERWEYRMKKSGLPGGAVNIPLPLAKDGANIVIFRSGEGDGAYPLVAGFDGQDRLTAVHIDFWGPPSDEE